jgi:hypothetical protein
MSDRPVSVRPTAPLRNDSRNTVTFVRSAKDNETVQQNGKHEQSVKRFRDVQRNGDEAHSQYFVVELKAIEVLLALRLRHIARQLM